MIIYDYIFYKIFKATRVLSPKETPEQQMTYLGPLWVLSLLEALPLTNVLKDICAKYQIKIVDTTGFVVIIGILVGLANILYFVKGKRWKKIVALFDGKESKPVAIVTGILVWSLILLGFYGIYSWGDERAAVVRAEKERKEQIYIDLKIRYKSTRHTSYIVHKKNLVPKNFDVDVSNKLLSKLNLNAIDSLSQLKEIAQKSPNSYIYKVDMKFMSTWNKDWKYIMGFWYVNGAGQIVNKFTPNPDYWPSWWSKEKKDNMLYIRDKNSKTVR